MEKESGFFTKHFYAIILTIINVFMGVTLLMISLSNTTAIDNANARIDKIGSRMDSLQTVFYDVLQEIKK